MRKAESASIPRVQRGSAPLNALSSVVNPSLYAAAGEAPLAKLFDELARGCRYTHMFCLDSAGRGAPLPAIDRLGNCGDQAPADGLRPYARE
jgi:hypothetical protein